MVTSAGALVDALKLFGAKRLAVVCPFIQTLTQLVVDYIEHEGTTVVDNRALEIPYNLDAAGHPKRLPGIVAAGMDFPEADVVVLSACVQQPSLPVVARVENVTRKPIPTAAIATTYAMLKALEIETFVLGGGARLSGAY